jgi:hypothetical protein
MRIVHAPPKKRPKAPRSSAKKRTVVSTHLPMLPDRELGKKIESGARTKASFQRRPAGRGVLAQALTVQPAQEKSDALVASGVRSMTRLSDALAEAGAHGTIDYDTYFEAVIRSIEPESVDVILRVLIGDTRNDAKNPASWTQVRALIDRCDALLGREARSLLLDPGIAYRWEQLERFLEASPDVQRAGPLAIRRAFIDTFPRKPYYRATTNEGGDAAAGAPDPIAPAFRAGLRAPTPLRAAADPEMRYMWMQLPFFESFNFAFERHIFNRETGGPFTSVSEHPEICWHAITENNAELWKSWPASRFLTVYRFEMSSFYALPRTLVLTEFFNPERAPGIYVLDDGEHRLTLPVADESVECLVPVSLPPRFWDAPRNYAPEPDKKRFRLPRPSDWT